MIRFEEKGVTHVSGESGGHDSVQMFEGELRQRGRKGGREGGRKGGKEGGKGSGRRPNSVRDLHALTTNSLAVPQNRAPASLDLPLQ